MKIAKIRDVKTPSRANKTDAGIDFFIPNDMEWENKTIFPGESVLIPSGIKADIPKGHALIAFNKSGVATKQGFLVGACVCDETYQGEIHIHLMNASAGSTVISRGQKIVQFLLVPIFYDSIDVVDKNSLYAEVTARGEGGFGSTGVN